MELLLFYFFAALSISFLCSLLEASLLTMSPSFAAALTEQGHPAGPRLARLKADVDRPLAAILSLNTIAHTVGAVGVGAQAEALWGSDWLGAVSVVMTLLILVGSEIIPKSLGAAHWRRLAPALSRLLVFLTFVMAPFVRMSRSITRLVTRGQPAETVSREELSAMAAIGAEHGVFQAGESKILQNLLKLGQLCAEDIMTPRTVVYALPERETVGTVVERVQSCPFSRIVVYGEGLDEATGYVLKDDVLLRAARGELQTPLSALRRKLPGVPASLPLPVLFEDLLRAGQPIALAVDEYGGTAGVVTLEDLVETLLGSEIVDEADTHADLQELARLQWKRRAQRLGIPVDAPAPGAPTAGPAETAPATEGPTGPEEPQP
jgi:CBS domain containing-hemolysin-like protein